MGSGGRRARSRGGAAGAHLRLVGVATALRAAVTAMQLPPPSCLPPDCARRSMVPCSAAPTATRRRCRGESVPRWRSPCRKSGGRVTGGGNAFGCVVGSLRLRRAGRLDHGEYAARDGCRAGSEACACGGCAVRPCGAPPSRPGASHAHGHSRRGDRSGAASLAATDDHRCSRGDPAPRSARASCACR